MDLHVLPTPTAPGEMDPSGAIHAQLDPRLDRAADAELTLVAALAEAAGFRLRVYTDVTDVTEPGDLRRVLSYRFAEPEAQQLIAGERITLAEFLRRLEDAEWIRANPEHPVAYFGALLVQWRALRKFVRAEGRTKRLRRGASQMGSIERRSGESVRGASLDYPAGLKPEFESKLVAAWTVSPGGSRYRELFGQLYRERDARRKGEKTTIFKGDNDE